MDEAYAEFTQESSIGLLAQYPNLIITRTFSKAYAMAGLRLGYILAHPDLISEFNKVRGPFDINRFAVTAGLAQIRNKEIAHHTIQQIMEVAKPRVESFFSRATSHLLS